MHDDRKAWVAVATFALIAVTSCSEDGGTTTTTTTADGGTGMGGNASGGDPMGGAPSGGSGGIGGAAGGGGSVPAACGDGAAVAGELCFDSDYVAFSTGHRSAVNLVLADCNGDGALDAITVSNDDHGISALQNDNLGQGHFIAAAHFSATNLNRPVAIMAVELDGLEGVDLVTSHSGTNSTTSQGFNELFAKSGAPCEFVAQTPILSGQRVNDLVLTELAGGAVVAGALQKTGHDLLGYYAVGSSSTLTLSTDADANPTAIAKGQLDANDNTEDIVMTDVVSNQLLLFNNAGNFYESPQPFASVVDPWDVVVADLDGQNGDDIAVVSRADDSMQVMLNTGTSPPGFTAQVELAVGTGTGLTAEEPRGIAAGDLDNDGDLDLVTANAGDANQQSSVTIFLNDGTGVFVYATEANVPGTVFPAGGVGDSPLEVGRQPYAVALGDLNNDGALDIVTSSALNVAGEASISVLYANP